jgi:hypothetical protein
VDLVQGVKNKKSIKYANREVKEKIPFILNKSERLLLKKTGK